MPIQPLPASAVSRRIQRDYQAIGPEEQYIVNRVLRDFNALMEHPTSEHHSVISDARLTYTNQTRATAYRHYNPASGTAFLRATIHVPPPEGQPYFGGPNWRAGGEYRASHRAAERVYLELAAAGYGVERVSVNARFSNLHSFDISVQVPVTSPLQPGHTDAFQGS
jgi:hypothetical protein